MRKKPQIVVLASSSPRRREFLTMLGIPFEVVAPRVDEMPRAGERPRAYARRLARDKAKEVHGRLKREALVIAADTIVVIGNRILEKPEDEAHAVKMLKSLSGRKHQVISGLCVMNARRLKSLTVVTEVIFKKLRDDEIRAYVASGEPMDKAGAYAVQGLGGFMVRALNGSYSNVVGMPVAELVDMLEYDFNYPLFENRTATQQRGKK